MCKHARKLASLDTIAADTQGPSTHEVLTTNCRATPRQQVHRRASSCKYVPYWLRLLTSATSFAISIAFAVVRRFIFADRVFIFRRALNDVTGAHCLFKTFFKFSQQWLIQTQVAVHNTKQNFSRVQRLFGREVTS